MEIPLTLMKRVKTTFSERLRNNLLKTSVLRRMTVICITVGQILWGNLLRTMAQTWVDF